MPAPADVEKGKRLYQSHCLKCHLKDGVGQAPIPVNIKLPDYIPAMPLDETSHAWHHSDEQLQQRILEGIPNHMPAFKSVLKPEQASHLVSYLKSLWSRRIIEQCQGPKHMSCKEH